MILSFGKKYRIITIFGCYYNIFIVTISPIHIQINWPVPKISFFFKRLFHIQSSGCILHALPHSNFQLRRIKVFNCRFNLFAKKEREKTIKPIRMYSLVKNLQENFHPVRMHKELANDMENATIYDNRKGTQKPCHWKYPLRQSKNSQLIDRVIAKWHEKKTRHIVRFQLPMESTE